jgi:predicted dehydrogenase
MAVRSIFTQRLRNHGSRLFSSIKSPFQIGFLGAGDISNLHASGVANSEVAVLSGLWNRPNCSIVPDPGAKAAEYDCKLYSSAEELCQDPDIHAVMVPTNVESHC